MIDFDKIFRDNCRKFVVCSNIEQRTRILNILKKLGVRIFKETMQGDNANCYPNLLISIKCVCGCTYDTCYDREYFKVSETEFISIFTQNKFDIYGNIINYE